MLKFVTADDIYCRMLLDDTDDFEHRFDITLNETIIDKSLMNRYLRNTCL